MNPYLCIALLAGYIAAIAGGFKLGVDHELAGQSRENKHIAQAVDAANNTAATAIAKIKVTHQVINQKVIHETSNSVVYRECVNTPDGLRLINSALTNSQPIDSDKLPPANPIK